jgi:exonuclease SbcC
MRPLQLSMTAFGPFPGTEQIDFAQLGENPLFLINGPTGSGKTTILDALCFALYGKTTGDERDGSQMCCDLALAETLTEVTLSFELAGSRYRIRRLPEQQRPKARGAGTTSQSPEAQLYELFADGSEKLLVSTKITEATRYVEELTGLSVDQFRQVMVLPQGKFRQLLLAESSEREKIFSQLFQTRIYKRLEEHLKERSAVIRRAREKQLDLQQGLLEGADLESLEALAAELQGLEPQVMAATGQKHQLEQNYIQAGRALQQAQSLADEFNRLQQLTAQLAELEQQKETIAQARLRLADNEQAQQLKPLFVEQLRCGVELQRLQTAQENARQLLAKATLARDQTSKHLRDAEALQPTIDQAKGRLVQLSGYRLRSTRLSEAQQQLELKQQQLRTVETEQQLFTENLQRLISQQEINEQQQRLLQQRQTTLVEKQLNLKFLAEQQEISNELTILSQQRLLLQQQLQQAENNGKQRREQAEQLEQQAKQLEHAWHLGQAAILAAELRSGKACPVCGSVEHPIPAHSETPLPTQQQLEQVRSQLQGANLSLAEAREAYAAGRQNLTHCEEQIGIKQARLASQGDLSLKELESQHRQLEIEVGQLLTEGRQLEKLLQGLQQSKQQEVVARQQLDKVTTAVSTQAAELATATSRLQSAEQELPQDYRQPGALELALTAVEAEITRLQNNLVAARNKHQQACGQGEAANATLLGVKQAVQLAEELLNVARGSAASALAASAFSDEQAYQQALLPELAVAQLKADVATYDASYQRLAGAHDQQQAALQGKSLPELAQFEAALQEAEVNKRSSEALWQKLAGRLKVLEGTREKLQTASKQQAELDRQYAIIGTLSDVANGQTGNKISLQRFVLSVLLDDVLIAASQRLSLMSKGRYQLLRKEDRAKGNKASGLELEVEDAYTGKLRSVATLSGGESFMAALSLALGLSDVVQAYAGGIRLDTLFIDEGFGSLDPESLDLAIRTLIDLQTAGRMVGIISHVAELKEQLPLRIDVLTDRLGSYTQLVTG